MLKFFITCISVLFVFTAFSQELSVETVKKDTSAEEMHMKLMEDTLVILSYATVNDSSPLNRFASCKQFIKKLVQTLKVENSFNHPFTRLKTVSIQYPPDSSFRIFTWQLYADINEYHYYGAIQMNTPELKMFPLIDRSGEIENPEKDILTADSWYGALYYNILPFETEEGPKYLVFGYDAYRFFDKRKFIDVLSFKDGKPVFGGPFFEKENGEIVNRMLFEYSAAASFRLNYDELLKMIVFDHLVEMGSPYPGQELMYVPDGDTDGLYFENEMWKFKARVYDQTLEEAPRPMPVLDGTKKDLFGN